MEGLDGFAPLNIYGGDDDDDDSGALNYVSLRYGGEVVSLANELNGLSIGGVGRDTDIDFVEIMNNVDDGIEIWGGTVNVRHFSVWNIGDDSVDLDQGYRGKMQFGLIVQGYSVDANPGSGVGDRGFEIDGSEAAGWQPVTTTVIRNTTFVGETNVGDDAISLQDGARVQFRSSLWIDTGDEVLNNGGGYGAAIPGALQGLGCPATTLTLAGTYGTAFNANPEDCVGIPGFYAAQSDGNLSEFRDSVLFNSPNLGNGADLGVNILDAANNNVVAGTLPIRALVRGAAESLQGGLITIERVVGIDPRATADAAVSTLGASSDPFFVTTDYRGGFSTDENWLAKWAASAHFGFLLPEGVVTEVTGFGNSGTLTGNGETPFPG
ncbi:MAG: hypothetical protein AAFY46_14685, partial [Planctomycetota bacterium]